MSILATLVMSATACAGTWAHLPPDLSGGPNSGVGFNVALGADGTFSMQFSDFGRARGSSEVQADGSILLKDGAEQFILRNCNSLTPSLEFSDGRRFELKATTRDFWELAQESGWEPVDDRPQPWRRQFPRWLVENDINQDGVCTMKLTARGAPRFELKYDASDRQVRLVSIASSYTKPISQLRAGTIEGLYSPYYVFDGDVVVRAGGNRRGLTLTTLPDTPIDDRFPASSVSNKMDDFLDLMARGSSLSIYADSSQMLSISLSGSSAAIDALKRCALNPA